MRALIVGADGQLGRSLRAIAPLGAEVVAYGRDALDVTNEAAIREAVEAFRPTVLFNAAAYTAVDRAENDEVAATAVNVAAVACLAEVARRGGARLVHVSTDFVFDGTSGVPYAPNASTNPLSVYGRTKLAGEGAAGPDALIVRTAWVYAPRGDNFVRTMLRLMKERPELHVVDDQIGTPTYAPTLANALWSLAGAGRTGIYHYTDSGVASWYDFAVAIQEEALAAGVLDKAVPIIPITTADYPTPAARPHYSVLDKSTTVAALGGPPPHWRVNLRVMIGEIKRHG